MWYSVSANEVSPTSTGIISICVFTIYFYPLQRNSSALQRDILCGLQFDHIIAGVVASYLTEISLDQSCFLLTISVRQNNADLQQ